MTLIAGMRREMIAHQAEWIRVRYVATDSPVFGGNSVLIFEELGQAVYVGLAYIFSKFILAKVFIEAVLHLVAIK